MLDAHCVKFHPSTSFSILLEVNTDNTTTGENKLRNSLYLPIIGKYICVFFTVQNRSGDFFPAVIVSQISCSFQTISPVPVFTGSISLNKLKTNFKLEGRKYTLNKINICYVT